MSLGLGFATSNTSAPLPESFIQHKSHSVLQVTVVNSILVSGDIFVLNIWTILGLTHLEHQWRSGIGFRWRGERTPGSLLRKLGEFKLRQTPFYTTCQEPKSQVYL